MTSLIGSRMQIGYHASHEQHPPARLLRQVRFAERAGFDAAMCSDHLAPFSEGQGESGFAWSWLGAALQATAFPIGVVTCAGYRYHPAVIAQGAATLEQMFPGRLWMALGSGEFINEHVTALPWPSKPERDAILDQAASSILKLLEGETVTESGPLLLDAARLFSLPTVRPAVYGAALTSATAKRVARWADGLITAGGPKEHLASIIEAFRAGGGEGKRIILQAQHSFAATDQEARDAAVANWRVAALPSNVMTELRLPADLDKAAADAAPEQILRNVRASADPAQHAEWLREYADLGFDAVFLHNVQGDDEPFIETFGANVLPALQGKGTMA